MAGLGYNRVMFPNIENVDFEENRERLKIVLPVKRNWFLFTAYGIVLLVNVTMLVGGLLYAAQIAFSRERFAFVFTVMLLVLISILYRFTRFVWNQWQFYATNREILFVNDEELIVRRPLSILGITKVYDRQYINRVYYDEKREAAAFDYGSQPAFFAQGLPKSLIEPVLNYLNGRYFTTDFYDDDDEV